VDSAHRRSAVRLGLAVGISAGAFWLALRRTDFGALRTAVAGASLLWLLPYPFICIALNVLRGEIWTRLLERRVKLAPAFWAYSVGFLVNNVLPFRVGEATRVVVLSTRSGLPLVEVAAAAGLERLLDMIALAVMLALIAPTLGRLPGLTNSALGVVVVVGAGVVSIWIVVRFRDRAAALIARLTAWLPEHIGREVLHQWSELVNGLSVLLRPSIGLPTAGGALIVWTLTVLLQWFVLKSFQPRAGFVDAAVMVAAISLAIALPAAPGFLGVYHWAGQQALVSAFPGRYDPSTALAAAIVAHAVSYFTSSAIGVVGLWYFGVAPSKIAGIPSQHQPVERASQIAGMVE